VDILCDILRLPWLIINCDRQIIIEEDNFEEGLVDTLIEAGIKKEDIVTSWQQAITTNK
jgi:hypothetical protein